MGMPVVDIREVRMTVPDLRVLMNMAMCTCPTPLKRMFVLVMFIVNVPMVMRHGDVLMLMGVAFSKVKPYPDAHQRSSCPERHRHRLAHRQDCDSCTQKWRSRKVRPRARGTEATQSQNKEHQTDAIAQKTKYQRRGEHR